MLRWQSYDKAKKQEHSPKTTQRKAPQAPLPTSPFEMSYPNITSWISNGGWVEIGHETYTDSFVRALDEGGMIWEGARKYKTVDEGLQALEQGIREWMDENS